MNDDENRASELQLPGSILNVGFAGRVDTWNATDGDGGGFTIGRKPECLVRLGDISVSRCHVKVFPRRTADGYEWGVLDNFSTNGTWIVRGRGAVCLETNTVHWFRGELQLRLANEKHGPLITLSIGSELTARPQSAPDLTEAEIEVLAGLRASMSNKEMAQALGVGVEAIVKRLGRMKKKLGPQWFDGEDPRRGQLAELAAQLGIEKLRRGR